MEKPFNSQNIRDLLLRAINVVAAPLIAEFTTFGVVLLVNLVSAFDYNLHYCATATNAVIWIVALSPIYVLTAYLFALVVYGCRKYGNKFWGSTACWIVCGLYVVCATIEACLFAFFDTYFTPTIATFLLQTTTDEAYGFIGAYVLSKEFMWYILIVITIIAAILAIIRCAKRWFNYPIVYGLVAALSILVCVAYLGYTPLRVKVTERFPYTALSRTTQSLIIYLKSMSEHNSICEETLVESMVESSYPSIVLIIGESHNKHHSELYGYGKAVNPILSKYRHGVQNGRLCIFEDVIVPYNATYKMLKEIFSLHSVDSDNGWNEYPLLPHIMRDAGFYVSFVSNQVQAYGDDHCAEDSGYFFQQPDVAKRSFDYRNSKLYRYDLSLLEEIEATKSNCGGKPEFSIVHLKGQHIYAKYNFPTAYTKFRACDYNECSFVLSETQKQEIADYDNATLYNDYVVEQIFRCYDDKPTVIIYMSDHGEEVHDYRPFLSRSHGELKTANEIKYQYQIPFLIYANQKLVEQNSNLVDRIVASQKLPFMVDDVSHIILGLSGVKCGWYNPSRDLLHDSYNTERIRMIEDKQVYRKIE